MVGAAGLAPARAYATAFQKQTAAIYGTMPRFNYLIPSNSTVVLGTQYT